MATTTTTTITTTTRTAFVTKFLVVVVGCGCSCSAWCWLSRWWYDRRWKQQQEREQSSSSPPPPPPWTVIPGGIPWIGQAFQIGSVARWYDQLYQWADRYGGGGGAGGGTYQFTLWGTKYLVVCQQEEMITLLNQHRSRRQPFALIRSPKATRVAESIGACGLFTAEGHQWQRDRRLVVPALQNRQQIAHSYHVVMKQVAQRLIQKWSTPFQQPSQQQQQFLPTKKGNQNNDNAVVIETVHADLHAVSLDILSLAVYGQDSNHLLSSMSAGNRHHHDDDDDDDDDPNTTAANTSHDIMVILDLALFRMLCSPVAYWNIPWIGPYLDGGGWIQQRLQRTMQQIIQQEEEKHEQNRRPEENPRLSTEYHSSPNTPPPTTTTRTSFLSKLVALNRVQEQEKSATTTTKTTMTTNHTTHKKDRIMGQLLTLFLGGSDSVGTLLTTAFWQLACHADYQESLVQELQQLQQKQQEEAQVDTRSSLSSWTENDDNQQQRQDHHTDDEMNHHHANKVDETDSTTKRVATDERWWWTVEDMMHRLPRLRAFVMEVTRCHGPLPVMYLAAAQDLEYHNHIIPQGTEVILLTQYANTHPTAPPSNIPLGPNGEEAPEFCPQRWLVEETVNESDHSETNESSNNNNNDNSGTQPLPPGPPVTVQFPSLSSGVHLAFGHGPRLCPGKEFAELEVTTCLAYVLNKFRISLPQRTQTTTENDDNDPSSSNNNESDSEDDSEQEQEQQQQQHLTSLRDVQLVLVER